MKNYNQNEFNFVKKSLQDGRYFKDAFDYYALKYINPISERVTIFLMLLIVIFMTYALFFTIKGSFPLKRQVSVVIKARDSSMYLPTIKKIDTSNTENINEAVLKYLLTSYLKNREEYDFLEKNIEELNKKLDYVKNTSSIQEYKMFQLFLDKSNIHSPVRKFGLNAKKRIYIESVVFKNRNDSFFDIAKNLIFYRIPISADIRYTSNLEENGKNITSKYLARIHFKFDGIYKKYYKNSSNINFLVTDYKNYIIK